MAALRHYLQLLSRTRNSVAGRGLYPAIWRLSTAASPPPSVFQKLFSSDATDKPDSYHPRDRNMAILYTCTVCNTRSAKTFSRHSYEQGIVLVKCPGCQKLHLIADHLGWFGDSFKIEDLQQEGGEKVQRVASAEEVTKLTGEDIVGWSRVKAMIATLQPPQADGSSNVVDSPPSSSSQEQAPGSDFHHAESGGSATDKQQPQQDVGFAEGVLELRPEDVDVWSKVEQMRKRASDRQESNK